MQRPFRFGVNASSGANSPAELRALAKKAEDLGFATVVVADHFGRQLAPLPAILAAADVTRTLRIGTSVLDNDFRHPAVLAKDAATIDLLTGGRLELGVGAGWLLSDYEKTGIPFDPPPTRYERLTETVRILKAFFGDGETVSFDGKHFRLQALDAFPKPAQRPRPPLMIGGRQRRLISFAAREADIVAILMYDRRLGHPNPPTFEEKLSWVREAAGDRFNQLEFHAYAADLVVTDAREAALDELCRRDGISREEALALPSTLVGSIQSICEQIESWRERASVSYFVVPAALIDSAAPIVARLAGR